MSTSSERHFEKALNRCRPELLEKLQQGGLIVRLLAHLHEDNDGYLSECEVLDIKARQGHDKVWEFIDCTKNKDETAFEKLCRALTKLGMSHLADCLKEAETRFKLGTVDAEPDEPREPPKDYGKSSVHPTVTGPFMERVPERKECNGEVCLLCEFVHFESMTEYTHEPWRISLCAIASWAWVCEENHCHV
jgi:hypothetical protein